MERFSFAPLNGASQPGAGGMADAVEEEQS
jgi:hypothetical protein